MQNFCLQGQTLGSYRLISEIQNASPVLTRITKSTRNDSIKTIIGGQCHCCDDPVGADPDADGVDSEGPELEGADPDDGADPEDVEPGGAGPGVAECWY